MDSKNRLLLKNCKMLIKTASENFEQILPVAPRKLGTFVIFRRSLIKYVTLKGWGRGGRGKPRVILSLRVNSSGGRSEITGWRELSQKTAFFLLFSTIFGGGELCLFPDAGGYLDFHESRDKHGV